MTSDTGYKKGLQAEFKAKTYLRMKGYRVLAERFKTPVGEIDLIVKKNNIIVFVEVKLRASLDAAAESIHGRNQSRVRNAAELYLQKYPEYNECELRFDALMLAPRALPRHIENAF